MVKTLRTNPPHMQHIIKAQQEEARENMMDLDEYQAENLDQVIQNTVERTVEAVVEICKGNIWTVKPTDDAHRFYEVKAHNYALEDIIQSLKDQVSSK